ncbi:unnamed protein product, partial [Amoebophrya sp. A25]|eukprot:GSA25T00002776001.1
MLRKNPREDDHFHSENKLKQQQEPVVQLVNVSYEPHKSPDRVTALLSYRELKERFPPG